MRFTAVCIFFYRDLSHNNIAEIPSRVFFNLTSLKELRLSFCNITKVANQSFKTLKRVNSL